MFRAEAARFAPVNGTSFGRAVVPEVCNSRAVSRSLAQSESPVGQTRQRTRRGPLSASGFPDFSRLRFRVAFLTDHQSRGVKIF